MSRESVKNAARIAEELGVPVPTSTRTVASEDEAREIARTLSEHRRAMRRAERLEVVRALREEGHSTRAIAGAVGVDKRQVQRDLQHVGTVSPPETVTGTDGKSYPATRKGLSRTAPATRERERQIESCRGRGRYPGGYTRSTSSSTPPQNLAPSRLYTRCNMRNPTANRYAGDRKSVTTSPGWSS